MTSKEKGLLWVGIAVTFAAVVALGLPHAAKHVPWTVENWLAGIFGGLSGATVCKGRANAEAPALLRKLVQRIYPVMPGDGELPVMIEVVQGKTVNAYATLGARIYVFDGLLKAAQSPDELAGVLAHEIEHVRNRHIMQGVAVNLLTLGTLQVVLPGGHADSQIAFMLLTLKFSRQQEYEADVTGLERLRAARVDAAGIQQFFARAEKMPSPPQIISNHPASEARAELAARFRGYPVEPIMEAQEWAVLKTICE